METNDDPIVRRVRCSDCAFTPGTEAHASELTRIKADLCVQLGQYFHCHRNDADTGPADEVTALCAGWLQGVTPLLEGDHFATLTDEQSKMMRFQLECLTAGEAAIDEGKEFGPEQIFALLDSFEGGEPAI